jgi:hypothetical protein
VNGLLVSNERSPLPGCLALPCLGILSCLTISHFSPIRILRALFASLKPPRQDKAKAKTTARPSQAKGNNGYAQQRLCRRGKKRDMKNWPEVLWGTIPFQPMWGTEKSEDAGNRVTAPLMTPSPGTPGVSSLVKVHRVIGVRVRVTIMLGA